MTIRVTWRWAQTSMGEKRHEFLQGDGRWQRCAGPKFCRECIRIQEARKARQA
jgi:hypothetical protein